MNRPIIATTLSGLFISRVAWDKAHTLWYKEREIELREKGKDTSMIEEWRSLSASDPEKETRDYFKYVDRVMQELYPSLSEEERTEKARQLFFDAVLTYIELYPDVVNKEVKDYFNSIKSRFKLALITTNIQGALEKILATSGLTDMFDLIECSLPEEKDDKRIVFDRFIKKYGKPLLYIGGGRKDSYDYCKEKNIERVFANLDENEEIPGVELVHSVEELKSKIDSLCQGT